MFTKKQGIYAAKLMLRLRLAFANRTYYTMTPRSGPNKTARAAVLHGSMFSKPCAPAQGLSLIHISGDPTGRGMVHYAAGPVARRAAGAKEQNLAGGASGFVRRSRGGFGARRVRAVSYTHLDVYKRQRSGRSGRGGNRQNRPSPYMGRWCAG